MVSFLSCEDEDKARFIEHADVEKGAIFRTVDFGGTINRTDIAGSTYSVTGELVSQGDVANVAIWVQFIDRTTDDGDNSVAPALIETADVSTFSTNENGLPEKTFTVPIPAALSALGLDVALVDGGDQFVFLIYITMADGRVFNVENTGASLTGELFFASPLAYTGLVICVLETPPTGTFVLDLVDNYGDGWQGSQIGVIIDGVRTPYFLPDYWGSTSVGGDPQTPPYMNAIFNVDVPVGTSTLTFDYVAGDFPSECEFKIFGPSGFIIAAGGPSPLAGEIPLNLCNE